MIVVAPAVWVNKMRYLIRLTRHLTVVFAPRLSSAFKSLAKAENLRALPSRTDCNPRLISRVDSINESRWKALREWMF